MRYEEDLDLWRPNGDWLLPAGQQRPESTRPHWSPPVFDNRKHGAQSKLLPKTTRAGDADGILSASLLNHPAFLEVKTWWSVNKTELMEYFTLISDGDGQYRWGATEDDSVSACLVKQVTSALVCVVLSSNIFY